MRPVMIQPLTHEPARRSPTEATTVIGKAIGPYQVVAKLGEGGMRGRTSCYFSGPRYFFISFSSVQNAVRLLLSIFWIVVSMKMGA